MPKTHLETLLSNTINRQSKQSSRLSSKRLIIYNQHSDRYGGIIIHLYRSLADHARAHKVITRFQISISSFIAG